MCCERFSSKAETKLGGKEWETMMVGGEHQAAANAAEADDL